jgi:hypothetical protein
METIPAWFWMIVIGGLSIMLGLILFYVAMLMRETMLTVQEARYFLIDFHDVLDTFKAVSQRIKKTVDVVGNTVETISNTIMRPVNMLSGAFGKLQGVVGRWTGNDEDSQAD